MEAILFTTNHNDTTSGNAKRKIDFTLSIRGIYPRQIKQTDDPVEFISFGGDTSVSESIRPYYNPKRILMANNGVTNDGVHCQPRCPPAIVN